MLITAFNHQLKKSHCISKIKRTFLGRQLIDFVPDNPYLVSVDVKSLYTNIANAEGINCVKTSLKSYSKRSTSIKVTTKFLQCLQSFQLQKLLKYKKLCHGNNLGTLIRKYLNGTLRRKVHTPTSQNIFAHLPQVYRQYILYVDRQ